MALDQILTVAALASGASVVVPHSLSGPSGALKPNSIVPDRPTPIGVTAATTSSVTFTNHGTTTESAFFWAKRDHSIQQAGSVELFWQGYTGLSVALNPTQWNDLLVPLVGLSAFGAAPPLMVKLADDGTVIPGGALYFNGTNAVASIPDFGDFSESYSIQFWLNSSYGGAVARTILTKNGTITTTLRSGTLRVRLSGMAEQTVPGFVLGAKNHIVVVVTKVAAAVTRLEVYVNGAIRLTTSFPNALAADNAEAWALMATNHAGVVDELRFYQAALSAAQVTELYAAAAGTEAEPTGSPTLLAGYHCNEGVGNAIDNYEGTAARDGALTNVLWLPGLVGAAGSVGVFGWEFQPGAEQSLSFSAQMNHGWKLESNYDVHIHWTAPVLDGAATSVVLGVELQRGDISGAWPATTTLYTKVIAPNDYAANTHHLASIATLPGAGFGLSHIIRGRVFRVGTGTDDFPLPIVIDNVDFHYEADTIGSRASNAK
jgi:hypothetical protein